MTEYHDGSVTYVYTHQAETAQDVLDMLAPHLGADALVYMDNGHGHVKPIRISLAAVGGTDVAFWFNGKRYVKNGLEFVYRPVHVYHD